MQNKVILRNIKLSLLKSAFKRSLMLKNNDSLNFLISSDTISSIACDQSEAFFKKWSVSTSDILEFDQKFDAIKVSIYRGDEFVNNVLAYFGEMCDIVIDHVNNEATKLTISNDFLQIVLVTAPVGLSYAEYDEATIKSIFEPENLVTTFDIDYVMLKQIGSLSKLTTNPETQQNFVTIYSKDGYLYATDNAFDLKICEIDHDVENVNLNKSFIKLFCAEDYTITIFDTGHRQLVAKSKQSDTVASTLLVEQVEAMGSDDFDLTNTDFNWDDEAV